MVPLSIERDVQFSSNFVYKTVRSLIFYEFVKQRDQTMASGFYRVSKGSKIMILHFRDKQLATL